MEDGNTNGIPNSKLKRESEDKELLHHVNNGKDRDSGTTRDFVDEIELEPRSKPELELDDSQVKWESDVKAQLEAVKIVKMKEGKRDTDLESEKDDRDEIESTLSCESLAFSASTARKKERQRQKERELKINEKFIALQETAEMEKR